MPTHELLHSLCFAHEHQRSDRDDYVEVISANINSGLEYNFDIYGSSGYEMSAFDISSVMMYSGDVSIGYSLHGIPCRSCEPVGVFFRCHISRCRVDPCTVWVVTRRR